MKLFRYVLLSVIFGWVCFVSQSSFAYTDTILHSTTWPGEKWEYLVEHPHGIHHIDLVEFEEILDTAGMHGWKLIEVTDTAHFYTFYFIRPLLPHKLPSHVARLARLKEIHEKQEADVRHRVNSVANKSQGKAASGEMLGASSKITIPPSLPASMAPVSAAPSLPASTAPVSAAPSLPASTAPVSAAPAPAPAPAAEGNNPSVTPAHSLGNQSNKH